MLFGFWQLKTTISLLLLTSCLGQELLRTCDRGYCYEQSIERRNIREDRLGDIYSGEKLHDDTESKNVNHQELTENRYDVFRGVRENRVDSDSRRLDSHRESRETPRRRRELREEHIRRESDRTRNENRNMIDDSTAMVDEGHRSESSRRDMRTADKRDDFRVVDRRFDETRRIERYSERTVERIQKPVDNDRDKRSVTSRRVNERENQQVEERESHRFNERLSETRHGIERHTEFRRSNRRTADENTRTRIEAENQRHNINDIRIPNERVNENEGRLARDESRRLPLRELETLARHERSLNKRERLDENRRFIEKLPEEGNRQEHVNRLEIRRESRRSNERLFEMKRLPEERENIRRLSERKNQQSGEHLSQKDRETRRLDINRESLNLNERLYNEIEQERQQRNREEPLRQLDNRDSRYETSRRVSERVPVQRRNEIIQQHSDNRLRISENDSETRQREQKDRREFLQTKRLADQRDISERLNDRFERRYEDLRDSENAVHINHQSRRLNNRLTEVEKDTLQNRDEIKPRSSNRNIREHKENENQESRRVDERRNILLQEGSESRRSQGVRESVERRYENVRELDDERREELRQFKECEDKHDNNRVFYESHESRLSESNENVHRRIENDEARRYNNRRDENNLIRNNQLNAHQNTEMLQRRDMNERERNERFNQRDKSLNYKDFHYMMDEYIEKPTTIFFNKGYMALGQGALLTYLIIKTLNVKNNLKYNINQKLQEAVALIGF